jgi:hypothetical protein
VSSESVAQSSRRSVVAVVAALSLLAAAFGYGALRTAAIAQASPPVAASLLYFDAGPAHVGADFAPARHLHPVSTLNDDKAFKSGGLKRDRPPTFTFDAPRAFSSSAPVSWTTSVGTRRGGGARAPSTVHACNNLLTQLCVSRR